MIYCDLLYDSIQINMAISPSASTSQNISILQKNIIASLATTNMLLLVNRKLSILVTVESKRTTSTSTCARRGGALLGRKIGEELSYLLYGVTKILSYLCRSPNQRKTNTTHSKETLNFTGQPLPLPHNPQTPSSNHVGQRQFRTILKACIKITNSADFLHYFVA